MTSMILSQPAPPQDSSSGSDDSEDEDMDGPDTSQMMVVDTQPLVSPVQEPPPSLNGPPSDTESYTAQNTYGTTISHITVFGIGSFKLRHSLGPITSARSQTIPFPGYEAQEGDRLSSRPICPILPRMCRRSCLRHCSSRSHTLSGIILLYDPSPYWR